MTKFKIGSTIKIAWGVYRNRFEEYYRLAFTNSFWILVPVYGWAKYAAMMGLLARLAYGDVTGNAETIVEAKRYIKPKTWSLFNAGLIKILIFHIQLIFALLLVYFLVCFALFIMIIVAQYFYPDLHPDLHLDLFLNISFSTPVQLSISAYGFYYCY